MNESSPSSSRSPCVLLIDDDSGLIAALTDALEMVSGYEVVVARDGAQGLERFMVVRPACVIVDIRMPRSTAISSFVPCALTQKPPTFQSLS